MKNKLLCGLSSAFFPMGLYAAVGQTLMHYQRRVLSAQVQAAQQRDTSMDFSALIALQRAHKSHPQSDALTSFEPAVLAAQPAALEIIASSPIRELLVIDDAVPNKEVFYRSIKPGVAIARIQSSGAGLEQLTNILSQYKNLAAVHIVSHAQQGVLLLGNSRISAENFKADIKAFSAMNNAMQENADLLLYGCDLAATAAGEDILSVIKNNTHVDVAASNNVTGAQALGGDWQLEIQQGQVNTGLPFSERAVKDFTAMLGSYTAGSFCNPSNGGAYRSSISTLTSQDGAYVVTTKTAAGAAVNFNCAQQGLLAYTFSPNANAHNIYLRKPGGGTFQISSMKLYGGCPTVHAYAINGVTTTAYSMNNATVNNGFSTVNTIAMTNLTGVTMDTFKLKLTGSCTTYMGIGNFAVPDPNSAPTNISLSASSVNQTASANATVGTLSSTDPNSGNTFTYTLVSGTGSTNNASFSISGSSLKVTSPSTMAAGPYSVRVRTTDQGALWFEKSFTITVADNVAPTVTSVNSSSTNGTYKVGDTVSVQVNFSEAVTVTGTPRITLETGATDQLVNYASGSGTSSLTFTYTVQAGNTSADLDYLSTSALALNGGTIRDAANNNATLTLAAPGAANSLGANKALVIDGVAPTVSSVGSSTSNGTYKIGDAISVQVNFSEAVTVTGTPQLTLETGATDRAVNYASGSGTSSLTFTYVVQAGDASADLDYLSTSALSLNGGTIYDATGNTAVLTLAAPGAVNSLGNTKALALDTAGPSASIVLADTALKIGETSLVTFTFNEAVTGFANADLSIANGTLSSVSSSDGGITWTATFTPTASITDITNLITLDNTGVVDGAGNTGSGTTDSNNYAIDTQRPGATIVLAASSLIAGQTSLVTITFSEAVTGFTNTDLAIANGTLSAVSSSDGGITWTATFTPDTSISASTNLITLTNTGIADLAGNSGSGTTDSNSYAIDTQRPSATISLASSTLKAGETSLVTITFSRAVTGFSNTDLTVEGGTLSSVSSSDGGITWTATFTPSADSTDATNLISLDNTGVADASGNTGTGLTNSANYTIDTQRPTATIVVAAANLAAGQTSLVTITFSEAVSGFTNADLTIANGTLSAVSSSDGGITWTATYTPSVTTANPSNVISLANAGVVDAAGNTGAGSSNSNTYAIDTLLPTATLALANSTLNIGTTSLLTITFSEAVSGFSNADLSVENGTLSAVSSSDGGVTWTATFTPANGITAAGNFISFDATGVADALGNSGSGSVQSGAYSIDTQRPTATLVVADNALAIGETSLLTITFSEAVSGFSNADLTIAGGALSTLSSNDGGITWTATLTPGAGASTGNLITLDAAGIADAAGNAGSGSASSNSFAIDSERPTATLLIADSNLTAGETSLVTITFSEAVTGFTNADLTIAGGTLSAVSSSDGGITWTATFTPTSGSASSGNQITLDATGITDTAGNAGTGSAASNAFAVDTQRPTATLVVTDSNLSVGETSLVTITFSRAVSGFTNAALTPTGGTLSPVSSSDGGLTWTATFTPTAGTQTASNTVQLANTGFTDSAGNTGTGTTLSNAYAIDTLRPSATLVVADNSLTLGETSLVTITFNEAVSGFSNADLTVAGGSLSAVSTSDGGITWTTTLTPAAGTNSTGNLVSLDATGVADAVGNAGAGTLNSNAYAVNNLPPSSGVLVADSALGIGETSLVTISFSHAVTGFTNADLTISGGTLSTVSSGDGGITWTATFTPTNGISGVTNLIRLDSSGVTDTFGNPGAGFVDSNIFAIDTQRPTATLVVANAVLTAGQTSLVTITFSEAVSGFTQADLSFANATLAGLASSDGGITWTATITPTVDTTVTTNAISLDASGVTDSAGNSGAGTVASNNYAVDTLRPGATVLVADSNLTIGETSLVTFTFSRPVTGFTNSDLTIAGGTLSTVASSDGGTTWTATFTPSNGISSNGVNISLAANGVSDSAGNSGSGSVASNSFNIDTLRPTATIVLADTALAAGETSLVTITFSEAVSGFSNADLTAAGGTLTSVSSADGGISWTATFTPTSGQSSASNLIQLDTSGLQDLAGNAGSGISQSANYAIDATRPSLQTGVAISNTALKAGVNATVTFTFSEAITGFTLADLTTASGTLSNLTSTDGGATWTATLTPAVDTQTTTNLVSLDLTGITDLAGNTGAGTGTSGNYSVDTRLPSLAQPISLSKASLKQGDSATLTIVFSEAVSGFTSADLSAQGGTLSALASSDGGITWTATLTPNASENSSGNHISLDLSGVTDAAGNAGSGSVSSLGYAVDTQLPSLVGPIAISDTNLSKGESATLTFTFSEPVLGFTLEDINAPNGLVTNLSSSDGGLTWTAKFTPTADISSATNTLSLNLADITDAAGNAGTGVTNSPSFAVDTQAPTSGAVISLADTAIKIGETSVVTLSFSEPISGLTLAAITAPGGQLSALNSSNNGQTWTALFTPNAGVTALSNLISLDNTGFTDLAGNSGSGTSTSASYAVDTQLPTASLSLASSTLQAGSTAVLTITFSEAVTGLTVADLTVPSGALSTLSSSDGGITWQGVFTPAQDTNAAGNQITLNNSGIEDLAGNEGTGVTPSANYLVDTAKPSLISIVLSDSNLLSGETALVTMTFSEVVSGFTLDDLQVPGGVLSNLASTDGGKTWTATFTPNANSASSSQISVYLGGVTDAAGNAGSGSQASETFLVDTAAPTEALVVAPSGPLSTSKATAVISGQHSENGVWVRVFVDADGNGQPDTNTPIGSAIVSDGLWSLSLPLQQDTDNHFLAIAEDTAGNRAIARVIPTITQDTIAPAAPVSTDVADVSDSGLSSNDNITNVATPILSGQSEPLSTITITSSIDGIVGIGQADEAGVWSLAVDRLSTGAHQLTVAAADAAGNLSSDSAPLSVMIDTTAPVISPIDAQKIAIGTSSSALPFTLADNLSEGTNVRVQGRSSNLSAVPLENISLSGSGANRAVTLTAAAAGRATVSLQATDVAGNSAIVSFEVLTKTLPSISGMPAAVATANAVYRFAPVVQDASGLSFSITNLPKWASFNATTGVLTGTPTGGDLGPSGTIVISVSDGVDTVSLPGFAINVQPPADAGLPILTVPAAVTLNANALFTPVTLQQLLGLADSASQASVDSTLAGLATDSLHSDQCCTLRPDGLNEQGRLLLPPGRHSVVWKARNTKGQTVEGVQELQLRPLVSFSKSQEALRGGLVNVRVLLNGASPSYPLEVPYSIDASSTATEAEYILTDGVATFTKENPLEVIIPVNLTDVKGLPDSTLVLTLGDSSTNLGVNRTHIISLKQGNVAPTVQLKLQQGGVSTNLITPDGGPVTATALITDVNPADTHSLDWSASDTELADTDGNNTNGQLVFDPKALSGVHHLRVTVTDSQGASAKTQLNFKLAEVLPVLTTQDSDSDGISDADEGLVDTNGNGIPDYLDNVASNNLLPQVGVITQAYLLECDPGVRCGLGEFVMAGSTGGAQILDSEVTQLKGLSADAQFKPVGGIFDFVANDLPLAGQTMRIVIPQKSPIPAKAVYRKFDKGGWRNFVENANNALHSTLGSPGFCPPPGDTSWQPGLQAGAYCVQLTLEDGGPNDTDGLVNAAIADPGYVGVLKADEAVPPAPPVQTITSKGKKRGGAEDGSLLLMLALLALAQNRPARRLGAACLLAACANTRAESSAWPESAADDSYVRLSWLNVSSGESQSEFTQALAATSPTFSLQRYDTDRSGWQLSLGTQLAEHWAVELGYLDLGEVNIDFSSALENSTATQSALQQHYPHASAGWTLAGAFVYELAPQVQLAARLGTYTWKGRVNISVPTIAPAASSGTDLFAGLELNYAFTPQVSFGV
ncbi:MAG TPA: Ig-like domain-containing protein, partial [Cellvibrionaceae bacterium]